MGMVVRTNTMALNAYRQLGMNNSAVAKSLEKLASGFRINRAGDDAAGLAISEKMKAQITGLETASANAQDGISLIQTAEGALDTVHTMLNRMVELATKSANGTYTITEREAMQAEVDSLLEEIDRVSESTNFNGLKLLDGSMAAKGGATSVNIVGVTNAKSEGAKGVYAASAAWGTAAVAFETGDTFEYTVSLEDGTSHTVKLTAELDDTGAMTKLVGESGQEYTITADTANDKTVGAATVAEVDAAILGELNKTDLAQSYSIAVTGGKATLTALEEGTDTPAVKAFDAEWTVAGTRSMTAMGVTPTAARDAGREIKATDITEYDGTNYEDAVFTINGKKFVLLTELHDGSAPGTASPNGSMQVTEGLGSDVTVLVGGTAGLTAADANFASNIAKIAEATGLKVTDAVTETNTNSIDAGAGIRLSAGEGATGGLVLQIGDTGEDFNMMRVSIEDMSAKALGVAGLDITSADSARGAVDKIKAAINSVSSNRAEMGAMQNRLEYTINNLDTAVENLSAANSRIRDTDMAKEMMNYTKMNVLVQSAQAMLAQANQQPQSILQLLQ